MAKEKGRTETVRRMTLAKRAVAELEEKKSIFIGNAAPVRSEDEAPLSKRSVTHTEMLPITSTRIFWTAARSPVFRMPGSRTVLPECLR